MENYYLNERINGLGNIIDEKEKEKKQLQDILKQNKRGENENNELKNIYMFIKIKMKN